MTGDRKIELQIEVPGSPEEVWAAIATGPGIASWYVPHEIEERAGGEANASFGPGMDVTGRVDTWEPPHRAVFVGDEPTGAMAFEWLVEARDGGGCIVRLVNSGFGTGEDWDAQYDAMTDGWAMFLTNLRLHLEHFRGQHATPALPMGMWNTSVEDAWSRLTAGLGLAAQPALDENISVRAEGAPGLEGVVKEVARQRISLLLAGPEPGTAFLTAEPMGEGTAVSVWLYLYGPNKADAATKATTEWNTYFASIAPPE